MIMIAFIKQLNWKWLLIALGSLGIGSFGYYWVKIRPQSNVQAGKIAFQKAQYETAFRILLKNKDNPQFDDTCMAYLGYMYRKGAGTQRSNVDATNWLQKAADRKNSFGASQLGLQYFYGHPQNTKQALFYFQQAASNYEADALYHLGIMFLNGIEMPKNEMVAFDYFSTGARLWYPKCMSALAEIHYHRKDSLKAFELAKKATQSEDAFGQFLLAKFYLMGVGVPTDSTQAVNWLKTAAAQEYRDASLALGNLYRTGMNTKYSFSQAHDAYMKAAEETEHEYTGEKFTNIAIRQEALFQSAEMWLNQKNYKQARIMYEYAANYNDPRAYTQLGTIYYFGLDVGKDLQKAARNFNQAAELGEAIGQFKFGFIHLEGEGVEKNPVEAFKWIKKAAQQQYLEAQSYLGEFFEKGLGVPQQLDSAIYWYGLAALQGNENAKKSLARLKGVKPTLSQSPSPTLPSQPLKLYPPQEGMTRFLNPSTQKWGFQNQQGQPIGEAYDRADDFKNGKANVWIQTGTSQLGKPIGRFFTIDKTGKCVSNCPPVSAKTK
jgi:TPR repeat protein